MAKIDSEYERWTALTDKHAAGELLSAEDLAFCERFGMEHPLCRREQEWLNALAHLDVPPSADSRALVDATLAQLSDESAAAERKEVAALKGRPRFLWLGGIAVAAAGVTALAYVPRAPEVQQSATIQAPTAARVELVYAAGEVLVDGQPARGGFGLLREGSVIQVGHGAACVAMDPGIDVCTAKDTQIRLTRLQGKWRRVDLEEGTLAVQLLPQPEGSQLSIVADGVWATAVGTAFSVERSATLGVRTSVLNGKVRVGRDGGQEQFVVAHQRSEMQDGAVKVVPISRSDESPQWAVLSPAKLWSNPVSATLELRGLPLGTEVWLDGQSIGFAPLSTLIPAGNHELQARAGERVLATRQFVSQVGQLTMLRFDVQAAIEPPSTRSAPPEQRAAAETPAAPQAPSAAAMLSDARKLMLAARFSDAAAAYEALRLAYPQSPEARAVLVSLAELQVDRLGQPASALTNVERYMRGEHGALGLEALQVRIRALRALGEPQREADAIADFLRRYPESFQAGPLTQRLADLKAMR